MTPTEELIVAVLVARRRLGEHAWTFPNALRPAVRRLEAAGHVTWKPAPVYGHVLVRLTGHGWEAGHDETYAAPYEQLVGAVREQVEWLSTGPITPVDGHDDYQLGALYDALWNALPPEARP